MAAGGGGSWKVAYADFVTAMMAFFMVMWLTSQDQKIKEAIAKHQRYFESALRDAIHDGLVPAQPDAAMRARIISAYVEGVLLQARLLNDINVLDAMADSVLMIARMSAPV